MLYFDWSSVELGHVVVVPLSQTGQTPWLTALLRSLRFVTGSVVGSHLIRGLGSHPHAMGTKSDSHVFVIAGNADNR